MNANSIVLWVTLLDNAGWDCFKTPILREILRIQNLHQVEHCAFWEVVRWFQSVGCVRNKLQFHTGLMLDGIPALDLWDLIVAVLGNTNQSHKEWGDPFVNKREVRSTLHTIQKRKQPQGVINSSHPEALLYVFEDNEAVIKMIIKGRSPTMRHVSRTHRVALDWLFDRINLDSKIQIKYIDTKKSTRRHTDQGKLHT